MRPFAVTPRTGCFRFYGPGSDGINNTGPMQYLSSGTEGVCLGGG